MAIRLPSSPVLDWHSSIASATTDATTVLLPQDTDAITVAVSSSVFGLTTLQTYIQTSPDGGTTFYDVGRTSIVSNTGLPAGGLQNAEWLSVNVNNPTGRVVPSVIATGSILGVTGSIGKAGASTLASGTMSGMPIFNTNRVFLVSTGTITATSIVSVDFNGVGVIVENVEWAGSSLDSNA